MSDIRADLKLILKADDVEVAVEVNPALWSFVLGVLTNPPPADLPPLPEGFLPKGYRSFP